MRIRIDHTSLRSTMVRDDVPEMPSDAVRLSIAGVVFESGVHRWRYDDAGDLKFYCEYSEKGFPDGWRRCWARGK